MTSARTALNPPLAATHATVESALEKAASVIVAPRKMTAAKVQNRELFCD